MINNTEFEFDERRKTEIAGSSIEVLRKSVDSLLGTLDFESTAELETARQAIVAGLTDPETDPSDMKSAWGEYSDLSQQATDLSGDRSRAEIGAVIHKGLVFRDAGIMLRYLGELDRALTCYSYLKYPDEVRLSLASEIDAVVDAVEIVDASGEVLLVKLKGAISYDNREHLRDMIEEGADFDDLLDSAYGMLLEEGNEDPDEVLSGLGIID